MLSPRRGSSAYFNPSTRNSSSRVRRYEYT
jgi:hypothetical protein